MEDAVEESEYALLDAMLLERDTKLATTQKSKRKPLNLTSTPPPVKKGRPAKHEECETLKGDENQDSFDNDDNDIGPKCIFSIHKIVYNETRSKSPLDKIREIMTELKRSSQASYEELDHEEEMDKDSDDISYGFEKVAFVQTVYIPNDLLCTFKFQKRRQFNYAETTHNVIIFQYRNDAIYAITRQRSWHHIQKFCCYDFPLKISARLTKSVGNIVETLRSITGNQVSTRNVKKKPTEHDGLTCIHTNVTREIRENSSIMNLKAFEPKNTKKGKLKLMNSRIKIGVAYIRFENPLASNHLPEILDLLSKICKNEETLTTTGDEETDNHIPLLSGVSAEEKNMLDKKLMNIIYDFLCKSDSARMSELEICDKHFENFGLATDYRLSYNDQEIPFSNWPTAEDVFTILKKRFPEITEGGRKKCVGRLNKVNFKFNVGEKPIERKLLQVIEVELPGTSESGGAFWKILGSWASVQESYYSKLHSAFITTLRHGMVFMRPSECLPYGQMPPWGRQIETIQAYVKGLSQSGGSYFIYENKDQVNHEMFDIMCIPPGRRGPIYLYYLFNVFNAGIRGASIRMANALNLFQNKTIDTHKDLETFFQMHHDRLHPRFGTVDKFVNRLKGHNVILVAAFRPALPKKETKVGDNQPVDEEFNGFSVEAKVNVCFTLENIHEFVVDKMMESLGHYAPVLDAQTILNGLRQNGFCSDEGTATEDGQYPISGKLLRLRSSEKFKIFENNSDLNGILFSHIKKHFVGFQGLIPKLEVLEISKLGGVGKVKIVDILLK